MQLARRATLILCLGSILNPGCSCGGSDVPGSGDGGMFDGPIGGADAGADATPPECAVPSDCDTLFGPPPCGSWDCQMGACMVVCPNCTDGDGDGYGMGTGCAGPDCDDADDQVFDNAIASCYGGPPGTDGVGECRAGTMTCTAGAWTPCTGEVLPSGEACNLQDDDCNGQNDDGLGSFSCGVGACMATVPACAGGMVGSCTPGAPVAGNDVTCDGVDDDCDGAIDEDCPNCVTVATTGNDAMALATMNAVPFLTVQAAINYSAATPTASKIVCVSNGATCAAGAATYNGAVTMSDGVQVYGGYESTLFTRCANPLTILVPGNAEGVQFPATVTNPTALDGFRIDRALTTTTAAVTVDGAQSVILSNLTINNTPAVTNSYGVNIINGGDALVTADVVYAGNGTSESIGVRVVGSHVTLQNNCQALDATGHCNQFCGATNKAIRGRFVSGTGVSYGVLLQDSPGSLIQQNAICGNDADTGAGVRIVGDGTGIQIRANVINAWGGLVDSHGIWMEDCNAAAPWVVDNFVIAAAGDANTTRVDAVRAIGDCHPVVDSNVDIAGGGEGGTSGTNGVHCGANSAGVASQCVVLGNTLIRGSQFGFPPTSVGVRCDGDGCNRIAGNVITGRGGIQSWGVFLQQTGAVVEDNVIDGGCPSMTGTGVYAEDSFARLQNNIISGGGAMPSPGGCGAGMTPPTLVGLDVRTTDSGNEIDVHSNDIDGGRIMSCSGAAVNLDVGPSPPAAGVGVFRNNIIRAGDCNNSAGFREGNVAGDPRIFESNDLDPYSSPTTLYLDEVSMPLGSAAAVDALTDMTVSGTLDLDPMYANYPLDLHLVTGSPCIGAGTPAGAPLFDFEGDARDPATPDIGADEF